MVEAIPTYNKPHKSLTNKLVKDFTFICKNLPQESFNF